MSETRKSIIFQAKFDTSEIPQAVEAIKRQMNQANLGSRMAQQGMGGLVSMPKPDDISKARRELEMLIRTTSQDYEKKIRNLQQEREIHKSLQSIKRDDLRDKGEQERYDRRVLQNLERRLNLTKEISEKERLIGGGLDMLGGRSGGSGGGGGRNPLGGADWGGVTPKGGPPSVMGFAKGIGSVAAVVAGVARAVDTLAGFPMRLEEAKGSAVQSFVGRDINALQNGSAAFETPWMAERARASEMAGKKRFWNHATDIGMGVAGSALVGGGAAVAGLTGWTGVGLGIGGGMMAGGGAILANDRYRQSINPFGQKGYNDLLNAQQGQDTLSTWEALKQQDPRKRAAIERLQGRYTGDLATQRMMGLGYGGFAGPGGFQEGANNAGFTGDMGAAMAAQMQGAGGSTRGMRGLSVLGLQAQRQFDLTNAGGVLGRVSGTAGGGKESEQIFRKIMEESIKAGLDKSDFAEEQRRFAEATSEILSNSGVRTGQDASSVLAGFSKYLGSEPTVKGIEGARGAYEQAQGFSAETGGRGGALQFAAMMKRPSLRGLGAMGLGGLAEMPDKDILASNPYIISEAAKAGLTPDQLVKQVKDSKREKMLTELGLSSKEVDSLTSSLSGKGFNPYSSKDVQGLDRDQLGTYAHIQEAVSLRYQYKSPEERNAAVLGVMGLEGPQRQQMMGPGDMGYQERMGQNTGRPEDEAVAASGVAAQEMLQNFRNFKDVITPATTSLKEFADAVMAVKTAADVNTKDAFGRYKNSIPGPLKPQTQAGKPSPGGGW